MKDQPEGFPVSADSGLPPRRRFLVIHNPTAGTRRARRLRAVVAEMEGRFGASVTVQATAGRGDAERIARTAPADAFDAVVVAGGDGTINEALNGLAARLAAPGAGENVSPLGIVPLGTANVLAHELGLPFDPAGVAAALARGPVRPVHLGVANGRCFSMMAGVGLDAQVVEGIDTRIKRVIGKAAYALGTLRQLARPCHARYRVTVEEGQGREGTTREVAGAIVAKGHFYGGRFVCAPEASLDDPRLFVCLFPGTGRRNAVRYIWGVLAGRLKHFPDYAILPGARVTITGQPGDAVQGDGDVIARLPVEISVTPWRLPVIVGMVTPFPPSARASALGSPPPGRS